MDPNILLQLPLLLVENELLYFLGIYLLLFVRDIQLLLLVLTFTLLVYLVSDIASHLRLFPTILLVSFPCLLELPLNSSHLLGQYLFRNVKVVSKSLPRNFLELVSVRDGCKFGLNLLLVFEF